MAFSPFCNYLQVTASEQTFDRVCGSTFLLEQAIHTNYDAKKSIGNPAGIGQGTGLGLRDRDRDGIGLGLSRLRATIKLCQHG